jgi:hypothetical protein
MAVGSLIVGAVFVTAPPSRIGLVVSPIGMLLFFAGINLLTDRPYSLVKSNTWMRFLPLVLLIGGDFPGLGPPWVSAILLSATFVLLLLISNVDGISYSYLVFLIVLLAGSVVYNVYYYYPLDYGIDSWTYQAVSSAIVSKGAFTGIQQPTSPYYWPFPIMSIAPSMLALVSSLSLPFSLFIFPGSLILLQPLFVFLVSRRLFASSKVAVLSALVAVTEVSVIQGIGEPFAEATAVSLLSLLLLLIMFGDPSREKSIATFMVFFAIAALHAAVGIIAVAFLIYFTWRKDRRNMWVLLTLAIIVLAYLQVTGTIEVIVATTSTDWHYFLLSLFGAPATISGAQRFPQGTPGIAFVWWGFPASLAVFAILAFRKTMIFTWAFAGLTLLGLTFAITLIVPSLSADRYGGLSAWIILAISGGATMQRLITSRRKLLILTPMMFLILLSSATSPMISPQFGIVRTSALPSTYSDRAGLRWLANQSDTAIRLRPDASNTMAYLIFATYKLGKFSTKDLNIMNSGFPSAPKLLFIRWANLDPADARESCNRITAGSANQIIDLVYDNNCDIVLRRP